MTNGQSVTMSELQIGDQIQAGCSSKSLSQLIFYYWSVENMRLKDIKYARKIFTIIFL